MRQQLEITELEAEGDRLLAEGNLTEAVNRFQEAIAQFEGDSNLVDRARIHGKLGGLFNSVTDAENALSNYLLALDLYKAVDQKENIIRAQLKLGHFYLGILQLSNSLEYYSQALSNAKLHGDEQLIVECMYQLGNGYNWMDRLPEAVEQLQLALSHEVIPDGLRKRILGSLGIVAYKEGRSAEALEYFSESLRLNEQTTNDASFRMSVLKSMGIAYFLENDTEKAIECMDEAMAVANDRTDWGQLTTIYEHYSKIFERKGDYKSAFEYLQKKLEVSDILQSETVKLKTRELQKRFDIAESQREKEIYRLKNIDLAEANEEISRQKTELQTKNRQITDSLFYAGRLQRAVLPSEQGLSRWLRESFVYFEPKDIVSGDFYWFSFRNDRLLIAAVDCTGHGVPGALISMMGSNILNELVNKEGITEPAAILQDMNRKMKRLLQNSESGVTANDGMDLSICSIDLNSRMLDFAGAHRPLTMVRNGVVSEIKGNRISIGGFSDFDSKFEQHRIEFEQGDAFYMYSDGYADQFGGPNDRKYLNKRLKELLQNIAERPMKEQRLILADEHLNWRGSTEQIDDILVIGFKP